MGFSRLLLATTSILRVLAVMHHTQPFSRLPNPALKYNPAQRIYFGNTKIRSFEMQLNSIVAIALLVQGIQANAVLRFGCSQIVVQGCIINIIAQKE